MKLVTKEDLIAAGWIQFPPSVKPHANCAFQKTVYSPDGREKKYFINAYGYDLSEFTKDRGLEFTFEVRFYRDNDTFDVSLYDTATIAYVERFFEDTWQRLGCDIDRHNN